MFECLYLVSVAVDEVAALGVESGPRDHKIGDHLRQTEELHRVNAVLVRLEVVLYKKHLLELEFSFTLNQVKRYLATVYGACWLPSVDIP